MSSKYVEMCIVRIQKESPVLSILITNIYSIRTLVALVGGFPSEKKCSSLKNNKIYETTNQIISYIPNRSP